MSKSLFVYWRSSLEYFIVKFFELRERTSFFYSKLFCGFILLNFFCYWVALLTAFPTYMQSDKAIEYVLMSFPVSFLGALFDILSLSVTLYIIDRALKCKNNISYIAYLSVDLIIATLAALWVLFVFMVSGWLVSAILSVPETLEARHILYQQRLFNALQYPTHKESLKNIFFGIVMGGSALLPTLIHIGMALRAMFSAVLAPYRSIPQSNAN